MPVADKISSASNYVCPFIADMDASGEANIAYVQQHIVSITNIDYEFDATLSAENTAKLLNAFTVSGTGPDSTGNLGAGDASGSQFNVTLSSASHLQDVLQAVINGAEADVATNGDKTATSQLKDDLVTALKAVFNSDDLINTVENYNGISVTIASAEGAAAMASGLDDDFCKLLYSQIPKTQLNVYMDTSENQLTDALPLQGGDVISFVFDVALGAVTPTVQRSAVGATAPAAGETDATVTESAGDYNGTTLYWAGQSKRIAFNLTMEGSGALALKAPAGGSTPPS
jgi:hypothetical protein